VTASFQPRAQFGATARGAKLDELATRAENGAGQADLLRAAAAGEPWAQSALYDALYPVVAAALQKILHQAPEYEDLVQATFEQIVRSLRRSIAIQNLGAWSSAIAVHVALSSLRVKVRERRVFALGTEPPDVPGPEFEPQLEARRELQWLQESLTALHPDQAETVLLHDVFGYDLGEIARTMGISVAAAQKRLSRGHIELRRRAELRALGRKR
jgi:RNA polymerase sigma-70 factor, ECF subfamily